MDVEYLTLKNNHKIVLVHLKDVIKFSEQLATKLLPQIGVKS